MSDYKHPEVPGFNRLGRSKSQFPQSTALSKLTSTPPAYDQGHIPGAVGWNWQTQLQDNIRRDLIDKSTLEKLLGASGISNGTTILLYCDNNTTGSPLTLSGN